MAEMEIPPSGNTQGLGDDRPKMGLRIQEIVTAMRSSGEYRSRAQIAEELGIGPSSLQAMVEPTYSGPHKDDILYKLADLSGYSFQWIKYGRGEPRASSGLPISASTQPSAQPFTLAKDCSPDRDLQITRMCVAVITAAAALGRDVDPAAVSETVHVLVPTLLKPGSGEFTAADTNRLKDFVLRIMKL